MKHGFLNEVKTRVLKKYNVDFDAKYKTLMSHIERGRTNDFPIRVDSPMSSVEYFLTKIIIWKQEAGQLVKLLEGVQITNDLIKGEKTEELLQELHISYHVKTRKIRSTYWNGFMKRLKYVLVNLKGNQLA